jgi:hypothetical protein
VSLAFLKAICCYQEGAQRDSRPSEPVTENTEYCPALHPSGGLCAMPTHQKEGPVKAGFHFVNIDRLLGSNDGAVRSLIRSNATKHYWREKRHSGKSFTFKANWNMQELAPEDRSRNRKVVSTLVCS